MKRQNIRTLALIVVTFTYLLVGAAIFDVIESKHEAITRQEYNAEEKQWKERYNISDADYLNMTDLILKMKPYKASNHQWNFAGAFYFSTTLITTIGYGHSTPKTRVGKMVCMLYSLIGIPLCIVMFQSIGERLNALMTFFLRSLKRLFRCKNAEVSQMNLIVVSMNICTLVLASGAAMFSYYEAWDYLDSVYYCFITLTTVGFGDMVALQKNDQLGQQPNYVLFSLLFIMTGLTVVSSAMNLLVLRFLTMNTEDVRRDELEQAAAAREAIRLEGDVITANGSILFSQQQQQQQQQYSPDLEAGQVADLDEDGSFSAAAMFRDAASGGGRSRGGGSRGCGVLLRSCFCCGNRAASGRKHRTAPGKTAWSGRSAGSVGTCSSTNSKQLQQKLQQQQQQHYTVARAPGKIHHLLFPQHSSFRRSNNTGIALLGPQQLQQQQRSSHRQHHQASYLATSINLTKRASI